MTNTVTTLSSLLSPQLEVPCFRATFAGPSGKRTAHIADRLELFMMIVKSLLWICCDFVCREHPDGIVWCCWLCKI